MAVNLELKVKLESFDEIIEKLNSLNAEYKGILNQEDVYYHSNAGLLKLRIENETESLIFYNREEKYKRFSDYQILNIPLRGGKDFFDKIFEKSVTVIKKRMLYIYDNTRIHLDDVEELGKFLELETVLVKNKEDAEVRFNFLKANLQLNDKEEIRASYSNLLTEKA
jgi:adenylate cyclase, class 2